MLRFNVAIKSAIYEPSVYGYNPGNTFQDILKKECNSGLLEEAKTMVTLDGYHENIVNLQGLLLEGEIHSPKTVNMLCILERLYLF